jgi:DNA polymerase lambda
MNKVLYLGFHIDNYQSILEALKRVKELNGNSLQVYLGSKYLTSLREKREITKDQIDKIKLFLKENKMKLFIHSILSLNFCRDPNNPRNKWGIDNLVYDLNLCNKLNGSGVVVHMGTHKTPSVNVSYEECVKNFIESIKIALDQTKKAPILLETPVNRENIVGGTLEGLSYIYNSIPKKYLKRVKLCVDTQHIFASGYNMRNIEVVKDYFNRLNKLVGIKNVLLIHFNDSDVQFDSRINRHAPIKKGYIFSDKKNESLKYIINFALNNKITLILETGSKNFKSEMSMIKGYVGSGGKLSDIKVRILKIFREILTYYETLGKKGNAQTRFRIDSYRKAIGTIQKFNKPIYNCKDVKNLPGIGKGFCEKIDTISKNGTLNLYENIQKNHSIKSIKLFQGIWGVGPQLARKIVDKKIYTINELKDAIKNNRVVLTDQQLIGLKYYDDLNMKIPREEITTFTKVLNTLIKSIKDSGNIKIYNAGSYRAGKSESGDLDIILTYSSDTSHDNNNYHNIIVTQLKKKFIKILMDKKIIKDILSDGIEKSIFIVKLPKYPHYRKMDIAFIEEKYLPWYLLYFGSSREFSKKIRGIASKLGYKLNEKGLFYKKNGKRVDFNPTDEKEIFDYLGIEYVPPEKRG